MLAEKVFATIFPMPELPEVETIRRALAKKLVGQTIKDIEVRAAKLFLGDRDKIIGQKITAVGRRAKILIFTLERDYLAIHLKMTGQLIFVPKNKKAGALVGGHPDKAYIETPPHRHTHLIFTFPSGTLYFNDLRKFGWVKVLNDEVALKKEIGHLGPEYDWPEFSLDYFQQLLAKKAKLRLKPVLMDQTNLAGIGNIYADESLFCAKIRPDRLAGSLSEPEIKQLHRCIAQVFVLAIKRGGTSSRDYRQIDGSKGTYLEIAKVYHRQNLPCRLCHTPIKQVKLAGRSTHFCPHCQK